MLGSRATRTLLDIATGKDPKLILKERVDEYQRDPDAVIRDLRTIQRDFNTLMTALTGRVRQTWGEKEVKVPEQKKYVKYTQNYMSRTIVGFDSGIIVVEILDDKSPKDSLIYWVWCWINKAIRTAAQAEAFAASILNTAKTRTLEQNGAAKPLVGCEKLILTSVAVMDIEV